MRQVTSVSSIFHGNSCRRLLILQWRTVKGSSPTDCVKQLEFSFVYHGSFKPTLRCAFGFRSCRIHSFILDEEDAGRDRSQFPTSFVRIFTVRSRISVRGFVACIEIYAV